MDIVPSLVVFCLLALPVKLIARCLPRDLFSVLSPGLLGVDNVLRTPADYGQRLLNDLQI